MQYLFIMFHIVWSPAACLKSFVAARAGNLSCIITSSFVHTIKIIIKEPFHRGWSIHRENLFRQKLFLMYSLFAVLISRMRDGMQDEIVVWEHCASTIRYFLFVSSSLYNSFVILNLMSLVLPTSAFEAFVMFHAGLCHLVMRLFVPNTKILPDWGGVVKWDEDEFSNTRAELSSVCKSHGSVKAGGRAIEI